jgi:aerobic-type carbon monoxide dehydrogenase small subunit (CoxS/CutS family)
VARMNVNGETHDLPVGADDTVVDVLRDRLDLTGTKLVCGSGVCGACTVLLDGDPVAGCLLPAAAVQGRTVETVEGIAANAHPVVRAFAARNALQCGFCTPGFVVATVALLEKIPNPTPEQAKRGLDGNICRCGTFVRIMEACMSAAAKGVRRG